MEDMQRRRSLWFVQARNAALNSTGIGFFLTSLVPVQRHRGEPGRTRDRHKNLTNQPQNQPHPQTRAARQTTPEPLDARVATHHTTRTRSSAVVVTVMATAPGRGSSEGASPTAFGDGTPPRTGRRGGKRLRHPRAADRAHGSCPAARTGDFYGKKTPGGAGTDTHGTQASKPPL